MIKRFKPAQIAGSSNDAPAFYFIY